MPKVSQYKEGILLVEYPAHVRVGLKELKSAFRKRMAICQKPHCVLTRIHGISLITDEAVRFLMSNEVNRMTKAIAIVVNPESGYFKHGKNILWLIKNIDKPDFHFEVFENEDLALEWLSNYCDDPE